MLNFTILTTHELYMQRCLQLAALGAGKVAPNPMVGAILVHNRSIIGEGYHKQNGAAHAEVNCINSVQSEKRHLIKESTLYVSLEPCNHFGKTPPCTNLILEEGIREVVVAVADPFEKVNGSGINKLKAAAVQVTTGVLEKEASWQNRRFFTFNQKRRPHIILKWAQSLDGKIAGANSRPIKISNEITDRLVHKWRSEEAAIMVGTNTALIDDPSLTTRLWTGNNPVRIVVDSKLKLPASLQIFNDNARTVILNTERSAQSGSNYYHQYNSTQAVPAATISMMMEQNLQSVIIEGGTRLLQSFIESGIWDEARVICNRDLVIPEGIQSPQLENAFLVKRELIGSDEICYYHNNNI